MKAQPVTPSSQSLNTLTAGGKSTVLLKNGNYIQVDGYYREADMLTFMKYGGTFSLPISAIKEVEKEEY